MHTRRTRAKSRPVATPRPDGAKARPCHCHEDFDARAAHRALSREVTRIIDLLSAPPERRPAGPGVHAAGPRLDMAADPSRGAAAYAALLRIVGGKPTDDFLACCCVGNDDDWFCSGVLIRDDVVLTAAHCGENVSRVFIGGCVDRPGEGQIVEVREVVTHPEFDGVAYRNDLALLRLRDPVKDVVHAELIEAGDLGQDSEIVLVGFGRNDPNLPLGFGTKRMVTVNMRAPGESPKALGFSPETEFVAGRKQLGRDSCNGDSGGPAFVDVGGKNYRLAGITSRPTLDGDVRCGDGGVYVRVDAYVEWITDTLGPKAGEGATK